MLKTTHQEVVAAVTPARGINEEPGGAMCVQGVRSLGDGRIEVAYSVRDEPVPLFGSVVYTHGPAGPVKKAII
jgi:hypothetical protein